MKDLSKLCACLRRYLFSPSSGGHPREYLELPCVSITLSQQSEAQAIIVQASCPIVMAMVTRPTYMREEKESSITSHGMTRLRLRRRLNRGCSITFQESAAELHSSRTLRLKRQLSSIWLSILSLAFPRRTLQYGIMDSCMKGTLISYQQDPAIQRPELVDSTEISEIYDIYTRWSRNLEKGAGVNKNSSRKTPCADIGKPRFGDLIY